MKRHHLRIGVFGAIIAVISVGAAATPAAAVVQPPGSCQAANPANCGQLFDDFSYTSVNQVGANGWNVRNTEGGSPGRVPGAHWNPSQITFGVDGDKGVMRLRAQTDGTDDGTYDAEISRDSDESFEGTYAAMVKFADSPVSGANGDHVVQTFFAASSAPGCDPLYSETDFSEYLPNSGYNNTNPWFNSQTTFTAPSQECDPDYSDEYDEQPSTGYNTRYGGAWHVVMATIQNGDVRYYIDGSLVGSEIGNAYHPRENMAIDFNTWVLDLEGHTGAATSVWQEEVDWVYYAENRVLTDAQVRQQVTSLKSDPSVDDYLDTVGDA